MIITQLLYMNKFSFPSMYQLSNSWDSLQLCLAHGKQVLAMNFYFFFFGFFILAYFLEKRDWMR